MHSRKVQNSKAAPQLCECKLQSLVRAQCFLLFLAILTNICLYPYGLPDGFTARTINGHAVTVTPTGSALVMIYETPQLRPECVQQTFGSASVPGGPARLLLSPSGRGGDDRDHADDSDDGVDGGDVPIFPSQQDDLCMQNPDGTQAVLGSTNPDGPTRHGLLSVGRGGVALGDVCTSPGCNVTVHGRLCLLEENAIFVGGRPWHHLVTDAVADAVETLTNDVTLALDGMDVRVNTAVEAAFAAHPPSVGPRGFSGPAGPSGTPGLRGRQGSTGIRGPAGPPGRGLHVEGAIEMTNELCLAGPRMPGVKTASIWYVQTDQRTRNEYCNIEDETGEAALGQHLVMWDPHDPPAWLDLGPIAVMGCGVGQQAPSLAMSSENPHGDMHFGTVVLARAIKAFSKGLDASLSGGGDRCNQEAELARVGVGHVLRRLQSALSGPQTPTYEVLAALLDSIVAELTNPSTDLHDLGKVCEEEFRCAFGDGAGSKTAYDQCLST